MNRAAFAFLAALSLCVAPPAFSQGQTSDSVLRVAPGSRAAVEIKLADVARKKIHEVIATTALVEPDPRLVAHIDAPIAARVMTLIADPGQQVKPGEPLAILSSPELGAAKTEFLKQRSLNAIAQQNLDREERLLQQKITSMKDVLDARAAQATAFAQYRAARETLQLLLPNANLDNLYWSDKGQPLAQFPLSSPIAGTLVKRELIPGEMVAQNQDLMTVMNLDHLWIQANVFEHDLQGLAVGEKAHVAVDAYPDDRFVGRVEYVSDTIDPKTRAVQARIVVPNPDRRLKPGMFAKVDITGTRYKGEALTVPAAAVFNLGGREVVFVPASGGGYKMQPVRVGKRGDELVEILSGLSEGQQVVSEGGLVLKALYLNRPQANQ